MLQQFEKRMHSLFGSHEILAAKNWVEEQTPTEFIDAVELLRLGNRFNASNSGTFKFLTDQKADLTKSSLQCRSLLASALADSTHGSNEKRREMMADILCSISSDAGAIDTSSISRFCKGAVSCEIFDSIQILDLLERTITDCKSEDFRSIVEFLTLTFLSSPSEEISNRSVTIMEKFLSQLAIQAPLISNEDLPVIFSCLIQQPPNPSLLTALTEIRLACIRNAQSMEMTPFVSTLKTLGRFGQRNFLLSGLISKKFKGMRRSELSEIFIGVFGIIGKQKMINRNDAVQILNKFKKGKIPDLPAARILWSIVACDLTKADSVDVQNHKWDEESARVASNVFSHILNQIKTRDNGNFKFASESEKLEYWLLVSEVFEYLEESVEQFEDEIAWAKEQKKLFSDRMKGFMGLDADGDAAEEDQDFSSFLPDVGPVAPALAIKIAKKEGRKMLHIIDVASWSELDQEKRQEFIKKKRADGEKRFSVQYKSRAHSAEALPWNSEELKIPHQAFKFSLRRANAHH
jgi:hypothetical protein